jgi:pimeloyl-ACP methyl ester carboxylesterase
MKLTALLFLFAITHVLTAQDEKLVNDGAEVPPPQYFELLKNFIGTDKAPPYVQIQKWFSQQKVDHFNFSDTRTFGQRYWVIDQYYKPENGTVLLILCGEYTCPGIIPTRLFPLLLAKRFNSMILILEHRYYGASQPFGDWSTSNFKYLTVQQALDDIAYFVNFIQTSPEMHVGPDKKWVVIGGSYPGALSAWFRYKYPHLTVGSIASSAVINSINFFWQFDDQIYVSARRNSKECPKIIQSLNKELEDTFNKDPNATAAIKAAFNATNLSNQEFYFFWADIFVETIQYGNRQGLCKAIKKHPRTLKHLLPAIQEFAASSVNAPDYGSYYLSNTTIDINKAARQWNYQVCSQLGWFQVPSVKAKHVMRSLDLNLTFWQTFCNNSFGIPLIPNDNRTNSQLGGLGMVTDNIIFTNGFDDPWQHAGLVKNANNNRMKANLITCADCGHCVEEYTPKWSDSMKLHYARWKIIVLLTEWFNGL